MNEEQRDKTLEALEALSTEKGLYVRESSPSREALHFLKTYVKELLSRDTWIEARQAEYDADLVRSKAPDESEASQETYGSTDQPSFDTP